MKTICTNLCNLWQKTERRIFCLVILFTIIVFSACEHEFIETDLSGKMLTIIAPADNDTVSTASPLFWWNEIRGARTYHLEIVYPDFTSPQILLYDTAVEADRFYPDLSPGYTYEWRIRPENGSSHGDWVARIITVDSSVSLSTQSIVITSPSANGFATSNGVLSFSWNAIANATLYRIEVVNTTSGASIASTTATVNSYSYTFPEGSYSFSVRAENGNSFTGWSVRTFTVDQTAPTAPVLVSPGNNTTYITTPSTLNFDWTSAGDALTDSLYIATDSTFASGIQAALLLNSSQSSYSWTGAQSATVYFWRVRSTDAAGNRSNYSSTFKFTDL